LTAKPAAAGPGPGRPHRFRHVRRVILPADSHRSPGSMNATAARARTPLSRTGARESAKADFAPYQPWFQPPGAGFYRQAGLAKIPRQLRQRRRACEAGARIVVRLSPLLSHGRALQPPRFDALLWGSKELLLFQIAQFPNLCGGAHSSSNSSKRQPRSGRHSSGCRFTRFAEKLHLQRLRSASRGARSGEAEADRKGRATILW
jgi:hypothetical protein